MPKKHFGKKKNTVYKKVGFGMRYQGKSSVFPFKSPHKQIGTVASATTGNVMGVTGQNTGRYQDWGMPSNHPSRRGRGINPNIVSGTVSVM